MDVQKIRVAILDDDAKFRNHLVKLLGKQPDISVVTEAKERFSSQEHWTV